MNYNTWIENKLQTENPLSMCSEWTLEMQSVFPELRRVRGEIFISAGYTREHWWLVTADGTIVDPTKSQFTDPKGMYSGSLVVSYDELDETQPEPTGMCPNCGAYCYTGGTCCSDRCHNQYVAYCTGGL